jgi:hypothetical protein
VPPERVVTVFVDVDDTLVRSFGSKQVPMSGSVESVRRLAAAANVVLYCWSSGGGDYARSVCERLGIDDLFAGFLPKPDLMIDDQPPSDWKGLLVLHPNEFDGNVVAVRSKLGWTS